MQENQKQIHYSDYLELQKLLSSQSPISESQSISGHDEMLFIIVHQAYEIWFKQILHELGLVIKNFSKENLEDQDLSLCVQKLERVTKIQNMLESNLAIIETMTPMDFLEFRDLLIPASGFQSVQFRKIEMSLGLKSENRPNINQYNFLGRLKKDEQEELIKFSKDPSILSLVEKWLERIPFLERDNFPFWSLYQKAVQEMLIKDQKIIETNSTLSKEEKKGQLINLNMTMRSFDSLLDQSIHDDLVSKKKRQLSQKAMKGALFILLYRREPMLTEPYRLIKTLMDIDENLTSWRYKHALLAHRMLGSKIGTGGSSGHQYLKATTAKNRIFADFYDLSTFIIPSSSLPKLPNEIKKELNFPFNERL